MQGYMPVFLQAPPVQPQQPAPAPEQQSALQPAPVDPVVKKLKVAKANIAKYTKGLKCTSVTMILLGCAGLFASVYYQMTAKHHAMMIANFPHPPPHHLKHGERPPPPPRMEDAPKYISREEFDIYESIKTLAMITFFICAKVIALGKCGLRIAWKDKSHVTNKLYKKSCFAFALIVIMSIFAMQQGKEMKNVIKKIHHKQEEFEGPQGRHLEAFEETQSPLLFTSFKDDEATCNAIKNEDGCNANAVCSWCKSAAVPSACHSLENTKFLPKPNFDCSKTEEAPVEEAPVEEAPVEEEKPLKDEESTCNAIKNEDGCNAIDYCSWCKSAAVPSACHSLDNTKFLPKPNFDCSKTEEEEEVKPVITPKEEEPLKDDEATCNAIKNEDGCNANDVCSWCKSAAVPSACHSLDNTKFLPKPNFDCSKTEEEEEELAPFRHHGGHGEHHGGKHGKHHGGKHGQHHGDHHKDGHRPRVQSSQYEDDEEDEDRMVIIAGMPVKGSVAKKLNRNRDFDDEDRYDDHHKPSHHKKHHKKCGGCKIVKALLLALVGAHFYFIKQLKKAQEDVEVITGKKKEGKKCHWKKKHQVVAAQVQQPVQQVQQFQTIPVQQVVTHGPMVEYSSVPVMTETSSVYSDMEERDKDMGMVFAPTTIQGPVHQMV